MERPRLSLQEIDCFVCNQQEAGLLFSDEYDTDMAPEEMCRHAGALTYTAANIPCMVVTMGERGRCICAIHTVESGVMSRQKGGCHRHHRRGETPSSPVSVIGLTYGKYTAGSMRDRQPSGSLGHTAQAENVCPRFRPLEFGLNIPVVD